MTLIELLIASAVSVALVVVLGTSFIISLELNQQTRRDLAESHDSQLVAAYLPGDLLSAGLSTIGTDPATDTGCASSPTEELNVARLTWSESSGGTSRHYIATYRVRQVADEWQLIRFACSASTQAQLLSTPAVELVVARNLQPVTAPTDLPQVVTSGSLVSMSIIDASGYRYAVSGTRRLVAASIAAASASTSPSPSATPLPERAALTRIELLAEADADVYIEIDFSLPLDAGCASLFSVAGLSGRGSVGSAVLSADRETATLAIMRGSNLPNTAIGSLSVSLDGENGTCSAADVNAAVPLDKAPPFLLSMAATNKSGQTLRKMETGDFLEVTYSEPVTNLGSSLAVGISGGNNNNPDQFSVPVVFAADFSLVRNDYVTNNKTATANAAVSSTGNTYTATLTMNFCNGQCAAANQITAAGANSTVSYNEARSLTDATGNTLNTAGLVPATTVLTSFGAF